MYLATDVFYGEEYARTAAVLFERWTDAEPRHAWTEAFDEFEEYAPGEFYRRELPCILPLIARAYEFIDLKGIVVDGYVDLGEGRPGLGRHLHRALNERVEIIGVAKNEFVGAPAAVVTRGGSTRPLYVTSTGDAAHAGECIASMAGDFRFPDLLRRVDRLSRGLR